MQNFDKNRLEVLFEVIPGFVESSLDLSEDAEKLAQQFIRDVASRLIKD